MSCAGQVVPRDGTVPGDARDGTVPGGATEWYRAWRCNRMVPCLTVSRDGTVPGGEETKCCSTIRTVKKTLDTRYRQDRRLTHLHPFLAADADSDVSSLDHGDIVGAVAYRI